MRIKKIASIIMVIILLSSLYIPSKSEGHIQEHIHGENAKVLLEEDFDTDADLSNYKILGFAHDHDSPYYTVESSVNVKDGKLNVVSGSTYEENGSEKDMSSFWGTRICMYELPDNVNDYTLCLDFTINEILNKDIHFLPHRVGIVYRDNLVSDIRPYYRSVFSRFTMGDKNVKFDGNIVSMGFKSCKDFGDVGSYTLSFYFYRSGDTIYVGYILKNNTKDIIVFDEQEHKKEIQSGAKDCVGLYVHGANVSFDKITIYEGTDKYTQIALDYQKEEDEKKKKPETTEPKQTTKIPDTTKVPEITTGTDENNAEEKANKMPYIIIGIALVVVIASVCVVTAKKRKKE